MSLTLQPSAAPASLDGLFAQSQSRDSESAQSISFGDVLKVEEKRLKQEQETSTVSVAATLVTMQLPAMIETIQGLNLSTESDTIKPADQTALTVDSVKSAQVSLQQGSSLTSNSAMTGQTASPIGNNQTTQLPTMNTATTTEKISIPEKEGISASKPTSSEISQNLTQTGETKTVEQGQSQSAQIAPAKAELPTAKLASSDFTVQTQQKVSAEFGQTKSTSTETSRPSINVNIPVTKETVNHSEKVSTIIDNEIAQDQKTFVVETKSNETLQTASKVNITAAKVAGGQSDNIAVKVDTEIKANQNMFATEPRSFETPQTDPSIVEVSQLPSINNLQAIKIVRPEIAEKDNDTNVAVDSEVRTNPQAVKVETASVEQAPINLTNAEVTQPASKVVGAQNEDISDVVDNKVNAKQQILGTEKKPIDKAQANQADDEISQSTNNVSSTQVASIESEDKSVTVGNRGELNQQASGVETKSVDQTQAKQTDQSENESVVISTEVNTNQKNSSEPVQMDKTAVDVSQPVVSPVVVSQSKDTNAAFGNETEPDQEPFTVETKSVEAVKTKAANDEVRQTISNVNVSVEEKLAAETESAGQEEVSKSSAQSPKEVSSANIKASDVKAEAQIINEEISQPTTNSVETEETILKNRDGDAMTSVNVNNDKAESLPGTAGKPKVENEPFVVAQENGPVKIQSEKVLPSAQVEIKSDEKLSTKEVERKSVSGVESTGVVSGTDKEIVGTKTVEKSSVAQVDTSAMDVIQQITSQMKARIKSGETSIRMQINPRELGGIEVQMTHGAQGVSVSFITEQVSTGQLLESQVSQLRQSLKDAGVQLTNLNINQHNQPQHEGGSFRQSQPFVQNPQRDVPQAETSNEERMRPQRIGSQSSEVDYFI